MKKNRSALVIACVVFVCLTVVSVTLALAAIVPHQTNAPTLYNG